MEYLNLIESLLAVQDTVAEVRRDSALGADYDSNLEKAMGYITLAWQRLENAERIRKALEAR